MYLLGIDLETTGLNPDNDHILEIGAVVWDVKNNSPVEIFSKLVEANNQPIPQTVKDLTGINDAQVEKFGSRLEPILEQLRELASRCDFLVGHNSIFFDKLFLDNACSKYGKKPIKGQWIDTIIDIEFPSQITTRKLSYLGAEHKISPFGSHRAVYDVLTMFSILSKYDILEIVERASTDLVQITAKVNFDNKNLAADLGFRWNPKEKVWTKLMRQHDVEKSKFPFGINVTKMKI